MVFSVVLLPMQTVCATLRYISNTPDRHGHDPIHGFTFICLLSPGYKQKKTIPSTCAWVKMIDKRMPWPEILDCV